MKTFCYFRFVTAVIGVIMFANGGCLIGGPGQDNSLTSEIHAESLKPSTPRQDDPKITVAGKSVGSLKLGDARERVFELFPKKKQDGEYVYPQDCCDCKFEYSEIHSLPPDFTSNGLFIYLRQGRVFQIQVETNLFPTAEEISQDSTSKKVRQFYPNAAKAFVLLGSGADVVGGRELVYWVDHKSGIAFEFYYNNKMDRRLVKSVIVFEPNTEFQPEGCVSVPQKLREIEPFSLEPPAKMVRDFEKQPVG